MKLYLMRLATFPEMGDAPVPGYLVQTDDGTNILMSYRGIRHGAADVIQRLEKGEEVDPADYYFRINPIFEAPAGKYEWLNRSLAIGVGHRFSYGPVYSVFEIL